MPAYDRVRVEMFDVVGVRHQVSWLDPFYESVDLIVSEAVADRHIRHPRPTRREEADRHGQVGNVEDRESRRLRFSQVVRGVLGSVEQALVGDRLPRLGIDEGDAVAIRRHRHLQQHHDVQGCTPIGEAKSRARKPRREVSGHWCPVSQFSEASWRPSPSSPPHRPTATLRRP